MKAQDLKKLVREEIKKAVSELYDKNYEPSYSHMKPFTQEIQQAIRTLTVLNDKIEQNGPLSEEIMDAMGALELLMSNIKTKA